MGLYMFFYGLYNILFFFVGAGEKVEDVDLSVDEGIIAAEFQPFFRSWMRRAVFDVPRRCF